MNYLLVAVHKAYTVASMCASHAQYLSYNNMVYGCGEHMLGCGSFIYTENLPVVSSSE
jgi:hypothetical protein